ncbi:NFAT activation molecule 1 isoform X3 [Peromyscus californicus insignis]|uniref:NFAT activation molecule 1 isoform X3 n=1 Tax=Peromyscus californicus insignis TaxID=564181 RepID=UPI0022A72536|nr:NFAT activation molecule 1 isoform X3 [Peromyscus californicus insignis]
MESRLLRCGARVGCLHPPSWLSAWWFLRLLLVPWTLQLAGGISVTHTGLPIMVCLANTPVSFRCRINHQDTPEFKDFTVSFFHEDLHGKRSLEKPIDCQHSPGTGNQTLDCMVELSLPNASATGTYYCLVQGRSISVQGSGTFILVRDAAYQPPSFKLQEALLFGFTGLLSVLSVLGTALLLWKKKQMSVLGKYITRTCPAPKSANRTTKPPAESIYTGLQPREAEVYACIEGETGSPVSSQSPPSKDKSNRFEDDNEFNMVYENL